MSALARALVESLDDAALDELADLLAPRLRDRIAPAPSSPYLDAAAAAERLRCSSSGCTTSPTPAG